MGVGVPQRGQLIVALGELAPGGRIKPLGEAPGPGAVDGLGTELGAVAARGEIPGA